MHYLGLYEPKYRRPWSLVKGDCPFSTDPLCTQHKGIGATARCVTRIYDRKSRPFGPRTAAFVYKSLETNWRNTSEFELNTRLVVDRPIQYLLDWILFVGYIGTLCAIFVQCWRRSSLLFKLIAS